MNTQYTHMIKQNIAPHNAQRIAVYDGNKRLGGFALQNLSFPNIGQKKYSFEAISDVHVPYDTSDSDFKNALNYANNDSDIKFVVIAGDLTYDGSREELQQYQDIVNQYSQKPVYPIAGNHEYYKTKSYEYFEEITSKPLYYSFEYGNDVFIMCGCYSWNEGVFTEDYLQWIYETLENNRNKRCIVVEHVFPWGDSGNPNNYYDSDLFSGTYGSVFQSLLKHYKNTVLFHGHSHTKYYLQEVDKKANYSEALGYRSVHISSITVPRDIENGELTQIFALSEGCIVDMHENHMVLNGMDFITGKYIPLAVYCIDTTLVDVPANTYVDEYGILTPISIIIDSQPKDVTIESYGTAIFNVEATGSNLSFQWQYSTNDGSTWTNSNSSGLQVIITSTETSSTLEYRNVPSGSNGRLYRCVITDANGKTNTTNTAKLIVE